MGKPYQHAHCDASVSPASAAASAAAAAVTVPSDLLFQPIAEDEPGFDEETLEAIIGSGGGTGDAGGAEAAAVAVDTTKVSLMTSAKFFGFLTPSPLSAFGFDFYNRIHATSLTMSAFP